MNVEIWTKATQFPKKEYINGILVAVYCSMPLTGSSDFQALRFRTTVCQSDESSAWLYPAIVRKPSVSIKVSALTKSTECGKSSRLYSAEKSSKRQKTTESQETKLTRLKTTADESQRGKWKPRWKLRCTVYQRRTNYSLTVFVLKNLCY